MSSSDPAMTPVVFCSDRKFAPYAAVATLTLIKTSDFPVLVYWLVRREDEDLAKQLRARMPQGEHRIEIIAVDDTAFAGWGEHYHVSRGAYIRLLIPEIIPHERALYLDGDILVRASIRDLLAADLGGCPLGGVANNRSEELPPVTVCSDTYLNSGVLLMDLEVMRRDRFLDACEAIYRNRQHEFKWMDQDVINIYAEGRKCILPGRWNWQIRAHSVTNVQWERLLASDEAAIIHFLGPVKPWQQWCNPAIIRDWKREADELGLGPENYEKVSTIKQLLLLAGTFDLNGDFKSSSALKNRAIERLLKLVPGERLKGITVPYGGIENLTEATPPN